jgi:hypothetical protein
MVLEGPCENTTHNFLSQCLGKSTPNAKIALSLTEKNPSFKDHQIKHFLGNGITGEGCP